MKLKISGKEYDVDAGASKATLQTLYVMQRDYGVNMAELAEKAERFKDVRDPRQLLGDPDLLEALLVLIWMARRHAGENMTLEESGSFPVDELEFVGEDVPPEPDPKEQTGSEADEEPPAPEPTTSKTLKPRSTSTSRTSATTGRASRR